MRWADSGERYAVGSRWPVACFEPGRDEQLPGRDRRDSGWRMSLASSTSRAAPTRRTAAHQRVLGHFCPGEPPRIRQVNRAGGRPFRAVLDPRDRSKRPVDTASRVGGRGTREASLRATTVRSKRGSVRVRVRTSGVGQCSFERSRGPERLGRTCLKFVFDRFLVREIRVGYAPAGRRQQMADLCPARVPMWSSRPATLSMIASRNPGGSFASFEALVEVACSTSLFSPLFGVPKVIRAPGNHGMRHESATRGSVAGGLGTDGPCPCKDSAGERTNR